VVEAEANDLGDVVEADLAAALERHQSARGAVDDHVAADAVDVQQAADLADLQLDLPHALHLQGRGSTSEARGHDVEGLC